MTSETVETASNGWNDADRALIELTECLVNEFQANKIEANTIGMLIDVSEDTILTRGFSKTHYGDVPWSLNEFESFEAIELLWNLMERSWDSLLIHVDLADSSYKVRFLTSEQCEVWRQDDLDRDAILQFYTKWATKELLDE